MIYAAYLGLGEEKESGKAFALPLFVNCGN